MPSRVTSAVRRSGVARLVMDGTRSLVFKNEIWRPMNAVS
jgi:hypothetical protein